MRPFKLAFSAALAAAAAALAQPAYPPGRGMPGGRWGTDYTPGWSLMTPAERDAHRRRMAEARTYPDCRLAFEEHRALMEKRAAERGITMRGPRRDACGGLARP